MVGRKTLRITTYLVCAAFLLHCDSTADHPTAPLEFSYQLELPVADTLAQIYSTLSPVIVGNQLVKTFNYNNRSHAIDIFNYAANTGQHERQIKLSLQGPEAIGEVRFVEYISPDSILITSQYTIAIISASGAYHYRYEIPDNWQNSTSHIQNSKYYEPNLKSESGRFGFYDATTKRFYFPLNYFRGARFVSPDYFAEDVSLFGYLDLKTNQVDFLPINYPEKLQDGIWGLMGSMHCAFSNDKVLHYGFSGWSEIYTYSLDEGKHGVILADKSYPEPLPLFPGDDAMGNFGKSPFFTNLYINPFNKVVFRFLHRMRPEETSLGDVHCLRYGNNAFAEAEIQLPTTYSVSGYLPHPDGAYLFDHQQEESTIRYHLLKLQ